METFAQQVCQRLPLAEAVWQLFAFVADEAFLAAIFNRHRGRSYEKVITFPVFVHLIADALLEHDGSGRKSFQRAQDSGTLDASLKAAYAKLARVPPTLSAGLLAEAADRLAAVSAAAPTPLPDCLGGLEVLFLDGKKVKHVAKRLKALRKVRGHVLGGKLAVALAARTGLAVALEADPDGEVGDTPLVPGLVAQVRARRPGPRLWVADRQFCDLNLPALLTQDGDHFLVRHNGRVHFHADGSRPGRTGVDARGRSYREEWGWIGGPTDGRRRSVRRIVLARPGAEDVALLTDLLDADAYPAADLLEAYLQRWGIERMFQKVTEVFHLRRLIGSTPEATIFQAAFCFLIYNLIEVLRGYVAVGQQRDPEEVSAEQLFDDVQRQLVAWNELLPAEATAALVPVGWTAAQLRSHLQTRLATVWHDYWLKAPKKKYVPKKKDTEYLKGGHNSVYRLLRAACKKSTAGCQRK
jgi:Transposase DDE domain